VRRRDLIAAAAGALAATALAGGVAWAAIPGSDGTIQGCYGKIGGILRVIDPSKGEKCFGGEVPISWNQKGAKGDPGVKGDTGAKGTQGIQGPAGVNGTNGADGAKGANGIDGAQGLKGDTGAAGADGTNGTNGLPGATGPQGPQGPPGAGGSLASLDSLGGIACNAAGTPGTITITYGPPPGGAITLACSPTAMQTLSVTKAGNGGGNVTSDVFGIDCGSTCSASFTVGTVVNLTATPTAAAIFTGWSGPCTGLGRCRVTMDTEQDVTANFAQAGTLTVVQSGGGCFGGNSEGTLDCTPTANEISVWTPADPSTEDTVICKYNYNIAHPSTCTYTFEVGTVVELDPLDISPAWGGACEGAGLNCTVTMSVLKNGSADRNVTATYTGN
jgi:hypothetical protein